jgi:hypothetical protein
VFLFSSCTSLNKYWQFSVPIVCVFASIAGSGRYGDMGGCSGFDSNIYSTHYPVDVSKASIPAGTCSHWVVSETLP